LFTATGKAEITADLGVTLCLAEKPTAKYCLKKASLTESCCWDTTLEDKSAFPCFAEWADV
jgi:hypothetical protein|tara:strand:- start:393 stop:575 length:183 start_codon:yes stop_codon:yes gene_type:complete